MKLLSMSWKPAALAALVTVGGCGDSPFQIIEELTFDPSLGIDLAQMERLPSGVYREDIQVGTGLTVIAGSIPTIQYVGWLADGTQFGQGSYTYANGVGTGELIPGMEEGMLGMLESGVRRIIIPPELGYGDQALASIPAGSVLIFQVTVSAIDPGAGGTPQQAAGVGR
jgi:peptidylprolyl isomerase